MTHSLLKIFFYIFFFSLLLFVQARASTDPVRQYNASDNVSEYNRPGATVSNFTSGVSANATAECTTAGQWKTSVSGICYNSGQDSCRGDSNACGCITESCSIEWNKRDASTSDFAINTYAPCANDICISDNTDAPGSSFSPEILTSTGDSMYAIMPNGDGFIEILNGLDGESSNGPKWLHHKGAPNLYLMIPSKGRDFRTLIEGQPDTLEIENACYPANFSFECPPEPRCVCQKCPPCPSKK